MNIVERLRKHALPDPHDEREVMHAPLLREAADLIEQQAERIKELEADKQALASLLLRSDSQLVALRQRIDDAPVVAWLHTQSNGCSSLTRTPPSAFDPQDLADAEVSIYALVKQEDLL